MTTETNELHATIYTTQKLLKQAADVIEHNMKCQAEAHTRNGVIDDTEVQASIESDADLIAELRAAALPWDQRHKSTERPPRRAHQFPAEQVAAVRAYLQGAMRAHGIDTQSSDITQKFEGLPLRKLKSMRIAGFAINGVSIERAEQDGTVRRGAVTTGGMVLWWHENEGQAVPVTSFGDIAEPVQDIDYMALYEQMCERCDLLGKALGEYESAAAGPVQPVGIKGYAMALNEVALKLRDRYKNDLLSTPLWAEFEKARNKFASSVATPPAQPAPVQPVKGCQHKRYSVDAREGTGACHDCGAEGQMQFVVGLRAAQPAPAHGAHLFLRGT